MSAQDPSERTHRKQARETQNEEFLRRLYARRPGAQQQFQRIMTEAISGLEFGGAPAGMTGLESASALPPTARTAALETIVRRERPVLFVKDDWLDTENVTAFGDEARDLIASLNARRIAMQPLVPLVGRIDVVGFPGSDFLGTGWFVDSDIVVTNRHVAELVARWDGRQFAFYRGIDGNPFNCSVNTLHEYDDGAIDQTRVFAVQEVLYIEPDRGPDIAFLKVKRRTDGAKPDRIEIAQADVGGNVPVFVVGYPARAPRSVIPDQALMKEMYRDRYDVKRAAPGYTMEMENGTARHDCTTLGGASGSPVIELATGKCVGLHFAGLYQETNYAVRASVLHDYVQRKRWSRPISEVRSDGAQPLAVMPALQSTPTAGPVAVTIPLTITVGLGQPITGTAPQSGAAHTGGTSTSGRTDTGGPATTPADPDLIEGAVKAFWRQRPQGVIAARVGFRDEGQSIGDIPFIAAGVTASRLDTVAATAPANFQGFEVRYLPATVAEQIDASPRVESVDSIAYDDDARTGPEFSFEPVDEVMTVRAHVGPEYSWDELKAFLGTANGSLVSAIYEFHAPHIKDAIEARLRDGASLKLVMDNVTFSAVRDEEEEFDRVPVFEAWETAFGNKFQRIVVPEGQSGLISDAYHIKVTVRGDDAFWLSSGNWKAGSSQPLITQQQRDEAAEVDLPGNREWHVVINNRTLAQRFRNHIAQDFERSKTLGGRPVPRSHEATDMFVDVPIEEAIVEERRPASRVHKPLEFNERIKVRPLLTPDDEGAVYAEAVLQLIRSARKSLLFQIPYIGMPSNPDADRGFIDELIEALTKKLKTLPDARVLLRSGGSKFSAPTHAAWFFKSKGVDIANRVKQIENHHTKGMIVDGKRVLIGSHNWSKPGVSLNRDASLIFDHPGVARYFAEAFELDWARANPVRPRKFVRATEAVVREAVGDAPPPGFQRMRLSELLKDED